MREFLQSDSYCNQQHQALSIWLNQIEGDTEQEKAVSIYYLVRDGIRYDPFTFLKGSHSLGSDFCLDNHVCYCIPKAALQITLSRAVGIPARLDLSDVKNHLSNSKLDQLLKSEVFTMHGYVEQFINNKWVKSTPTFDKALCQKANIQPLEFDGMNNSIFHQFTPDGAKHMEYLTDHGYFHDMPTSFIRENFIKHYPHLAPPF